MQYAVITFVNVRIITFSYYVFHNLNTYIFVSYIYVLSSDYTLLTPEYLTTNEGSRACFKCLAESVIQWTFNYKAITKYIHKFYFSNRETVLQIDQTKNTNGGIYECIGQSTEHGIFRAVSRLEVIG